ncbi:MAG TPA: hypothetical protein VH701_02850, partial [Vicinamibacterales bacterium]
MPTATFPKSRHPGGRTSPSGIATAAPTGAVAAAFGAGELRAPGDAGAGGLGPAGGGVPEGAVADWLRPAPAA